MKLYNPEILVALDENEEKGIFSATINGSSVTACHFIIVYSLVTKLFVLRLGRSEPLLCLVDCAPNFSSVLLYPFCSLHALFSAWISVITFSMLSVTPFALNSQFSTQSCRLWLWICHFQACCESIIAGCHETVSSIVRCVFCRDQRPTVLAYFMPSTQALIYKRHSLKYNYSG